MIIGNELTLKSITGYRQIKWDIGTDLDGTPETLQEVTDQQHQWQWSEEIQLLGKALDDRLNYVAGLYYFTEGGYVHDYVPFESLLYVYDVANDVKNTDYAAFVHADWNITDRWGLTAGGRYTHVKADFLGGQSDLNSFPLGSTLYPIITGQPYLRYYPPIPDTQSWDIFTPTVGVQFHFDKDVMAYASWSKGFKAGGWTTRLSAVDHRSEDGRVQAGILEHLRTRAQVRIPQPPAARQCGRLLHRLHRHPAEHPAGHLAGVHQRRQRQDQGCGT